MNPRLDPQSPRRPLTKRAVLVLLAVCAGLALFARGRTRVAEPVRAEATEAPREPESATTVVTTEPAAPTAGKAGAPPVVDAIDVERPIICAGEESLVRVKAHAASGDDLGTHVIIDGQRGDAVPVVGQLMNGAGRPVTARVFSWTGESTTVAIPLEVRDCTPERRALVTYTRLANGSDEYELTARVLDVPSVHGKSGKAMPVSAVRRYKWSFGDGTATETSEPTVVHSYADRAQERVFTTELIAVEALMDGGGRVQGRTSIELLNRGRQTMIDRGVALIEAGYHPRFPELQPDGSVALTAHLTHVMPDDVTITRVTARVTHAGQTGAPSSRQLAAEDVLGATVIPARKGLDVVLRLDAEDESVTMITYDLAGTTRDGKPAAGSVTIMRPPPAPTADANEPVEDAAFVAKIRAARRVLGKPLVTGEEIARLEREGRI